LEIKMEKDTTAAVAAGATASLALLVFGAPMWAGILGFAGVGFLTKKVIDWTSDNEGDNSNV
jgi:hypothetical protein